MAGVVGHPVAHSLSPVLHNAAFEALGLDWVYVAFDAPDGALAVAAMRALGLRGLSVTMPHKASVAGAVDRLTPTAARLGAVNTVRIDGDDLLGDSTDGQGLLDALAADHGLDPAGRTAVVLGAGGAARAVCLALGQAGAVVTVAARRPDAASPAAALAGPAGRVGPIEAAYDADVVVDATSVGMGRSDQALPLGIDPTRFGPGQHVVDLVYAPPVTPLLEGARAAGAVAVNGLGMLVHQAGHQLRAWTGLEPPLGAMSAAALEAVVTGR